MKKAMITIEVLVSMLILFLVISTSFSSIKFFNIMSIKKQDYENEYMLVLSLRDKLSQTICKTSLYEDGKFNGYSYTASCDKVKELRTFVSGDEETSISGNIGKYSIQLYKVNLVLSKKNYFKKNNYYVTRSIKVNEDE